jgi:fatty acid desaturase
MLAIALDWLAISASVAAAMAVANIWVTLACLILIGCRQHALFVMVHDGAHFNLSRSKVVNEFLADYLCAFPVLFDTLAYRKNHLAHHRHLNTDKDPDWIRKAGQTEWTFPVGAGRLISFIPYFIFLKGPLEWSYIVFKFSGFFERERWNTNPLRQMGKAAFYLSAAATIAYFHLVPVVLLYWFTPLFFVFPLLQRLRSVAEHFSLPRTSELTSSRDVTPTWLEGFLLSPHNVNYHLVHHTYPHIPFYDLPKAYAELSQTSLQNGYRNTSYLFPLNGSLLHDLIHGPQTFVEIEYTEKKAA